MITQIYIIINIIIIVIVIVIIIVIVIVAILSMYEDVNLQVEKPVGGRSTSLASLVTENEPAVLVACKMSATQVNFNAVMMVIMMMMMMVLLACKISSTQVSLLPGVVMMVIVRGKVLELLLVSKLT